MRKISETDAFDLTSIVQDEMGWSNAQMDALAYDFMVGYNYGALLPEWVDYVKARAEK